MSISLLACKLTFCKHYTCLVFPPLFALNPTTLLLVAAVAQREQKIELAIDSWHQREIDSFRLTACSCDTPNRPSNGVFRLQQINVTLIYTANNYLVIMSRKQFCKATFLAALIMPTPLFTIKFTACKDSMNIVQIEPGQSLGFANHLTTWAQVENAPDHVFQPCDRCTAPRRFRFYSIRLHAILSPIVLHAWHNASFLHAAPQLPPPFHVSTSG